MAATPAEQRAATVERAREALVEGGLEGADQLLGELAVPGLGLGVGWLRRGAAAVSRRRKEQEALRASTQLMTEVTASQQSAAKDAAELVTSIAHPDVPAIIVVEDLHLMSPDFAEFLEVAAARQAGRPVLIIGTAWPEGLHNPPFDRWRRWAAVHGNLDVWEVPDLGQDDLSDAALLLRAEHRVGCGAIDLLSRLVPDRARIIGADHPDTLVTRSNLAMCLARNGRVAEAIEMNTRLVSDRERILGPNHPATLFTRNELANLKEQQSD